MHKNAGMSEIVSKCKKTWNDHYTIMVLYKVAN